MTDSYYQYHAKALARLLKSLPAAASPLQKAFIQAFFAKVHISDLERYDAQSACQMALSALQFFESRKKDTPKIRIFRPTKAEHGYESRSTVIELLNDDMPFLVDSLTAELTRQGLTIRETVHPIIYVQRDKAGTLQKVSATPDSAAFRAESLIHFEVSALPDSTSFQQLQADLEWVLQYIHCSVEDWQSIMNKAQAQASGIIQQNKLFFDQDSLSEASAFLRWLVERNFVFLGYAEYNFFDEKGREKLSAVEGSKLGILKITTDTTFRGLESLSPELRHLVLVPKLIEITKTMRRSPVHRPVPMDCIGIKRFNGKGEVIGEARFLGLFTSNVYYQSSESIPLLRHKIGRVLERADFGAASHDGKALKAILEFLPRDEVFQISEDELLETSLGILALEARPSVRVFVRQDAFERFVSLMVFVPRERFSTDLRHQIQRVVEKAYDGTTSSFTTQITEAPLARLHLIIKTTQGGIPSVEPTALEAEIARLAYLWGDLLLEELQRQHPDSAALALHQGYQAAFPQSYINRYSAAAAVFDISKTELARKSGSLALEFYQPSQEQQRLCHLKIYSTKEEIALSDILPMLENAGFRVIEEYPFQITHSSGTAVWLRDFRLEIPAGLKLDIDTVKPLLEEALLSIWNQETENDRFSALIIKAALSARDILVLRAYAKYAKQIGFPYDQSAIEQALSSQPHIARQLVTLFATRFHPAQKNRTAEQQKLLEKLQESLAEVSTVSEDRILRRIMDLILATLRTNYYQTLADGRSKPVLSFKFKSSEVPELPLPRPHAEIFVYSPRVEGIHLRGGKVARGGLRWSDRHDDFRTEVLGLMKAQMVKNAVIVPVGSKGGFVVKRPPATRDAYMEEGIACYKLYLSGLLDITDNIIAGKITPPAACTRHDGDDPYLVVAADKGTATFSDIANAMSAQYSFWLGDAFASGGSAGYDHKKMAITARGAWVSVVRHFREMGIDIDKETFTVVGIGDMAGDVFGNGMLLSKNIKLLAAFNHMHIFLDPTPDAAKSFAERKRMFNLPRSSWKDYDEKLISKGGGIYERSAKSITVSKEAQSALGLTKATFAPDELIRALLLAPVDLLWNGGIGTYVKAEDETHQQVGDRANNALRVNGRELRAKVIGEGGNLGFTQKGRIEYARNGGRINTDAIDNSAGVDCSDHEVNIKIAYSSELASGRITLAKRDKQLESMTDEVARLVLKDNILQTQALTITQGQGHALLESHLRLIHQLERAGLLDRAIEFLPTDKQFAELRSRKEGLTRPELAVLLAYSKMHLYNELLGSTLPDEAYFNADLGRYFPIPMQKEHLESIASHPLRREIIATVATNSIVNRAGITFVSGIAEDTGAGARDVVAAYTLARDVFGVRQWWNAVEAESSMSVAAQVEIYASISTFLETLTRWILRNLPLPLEIERAAAEIQPEIAEITSKLDKLYSPQTRAASSTRREALLALGVPAKLAATISQLDMLACAFDLIAVAHKTGKSIVDVGGLYFALGERLSFASLRAKASAIPAASQWDRMAAQALIGDYYDEQRRLTLALLENQLSLPAWLTAHDESLMRYDRLTQSLAGNIDLAQLMVVLRHIRGL